MRHFYIHTINGANRDHLYFYTCVRAWQAMLGYKNVSGHSHFVGLMRRKIVRTAIWAYLFARACIAGPTLLFR